MGIPSVADHDVVLPVHEPVDLRADAHMVRGDGLAFPGQGAEGFLLSCLVPQKIDPRGKPPTEFRRVPFFRDHSIQDREESFNVAVNPEVNGPVAPDLFGVDVHLHQLGLGVQQIPVGIIQADAVSQQDDQVGILQGIRCGAGADGRCRFET